MYYYYYYFREREPQILDYQTQQYKLIPYIAYFYAFRFSAEWLSNIYHQVTANMKDGNLEQLPEVCLFFYSEQVTILN